MVNETSKTIKNILTGEVVSDKMDKTVVVKIDRIYVHPVFKKTIKKVKKYKVHDESEVAKTGDLVEFYEGRPVSKTKYMYLHRVIKTSVN